MALYDLDITTAPLNVSALLMVADGSSTTVRAINAGQYAVYRAVSENAPSDLNGAIWVHNPGERWRMAIYAGAVDGNTWLIAASNPTRVILEDNAP